MMRGTDNILNVYNTSIIVTLLSVLSSGGSPGIENRKFLAYLSTGTGGPWIS